MITAHMVIVGLIIIYFLLGFAFGYLAVKLEYGKIVLGELLGYTLFWWIYLIDEMNQ